jgi:hypothetical protein
MMSICFVYAVQFISFQNRNSKTKDPEKWYFTSMENKISYRWWRSAHLQLPGVIKMVIYLWITLLGEVKKTTVGNFNISHT